MFAYDVQESRNYVAGLQVAKIYCTKSVSDANFSDAVSLKTYFVERFL